jgi:N-acetylated-alpha-linked acidic dipeptidase
VQKEGVVLVKLSDLERSVLATIDGDEMWRTLEYLNTVDRTSGTDGEFRSVRWLTAKLEEYGVPYELHEFEAFLSIPVRANLRVVGPVEREIRTKTKAFGRNTPPAGIVGELVYVPVVADEVGLMDEKANPERDFIGRDVQGKVVLSPRGGPGAVEAAYLAGAIAHVQYWSTGEDAIHEMIATPVWGTPTDETIGNLPKIPALTINLADGKDLIELCKEHGAVRVSLRAETETGWRKQLLPVVTITGTEEPDQFALIASHIDSWHVGITDNGTGNAACLELARVLHQHRDQLKRSVKIAWWTGHSTGRYAGSTWFADNFWVELNQGCLGYINIDSPGSKNALDYSDLTATEDVTALVAETVSAVANSAGQPERPFRAGDQSFWGAGVSSLHMLLSNLPREQWFDVGGCGMNWWWHTEYDTLGTADRDILVKDTQIYALGALRLTQPERLPHLATPLAEAVERLLGALSEVAGDRLDLSGAIVAASEFRATAALFDAAKTSGIGESRSLNAATLAMLRIMIPLLYTKVGLFDHDPATSVPPLPGLDPVRRMAQLDQISDEFKLLKTRMVRQRNRTIHELNRATRTLLAHLTTKA